jgi:Ca2+-binding EF-hand superfamily protein
MALAKQPPGVARQIFERYDRDNSNAISGKEFRALCYDLGYYLSEAELNQALLQLSSASSDSAAASSGEVDWVSFQRFWRSEGRFQKLQLSNRHLEELQHCAAYFKYFDADTRYVVGGCVCDFCVL